MYSSGISTIINNNTVLSPGPSIALGAQLKGLKFANLDNDPKIEFVGYEGNKVYYGDIDTTSAIPLLRTYTFTFDSILSLEIGNFGHGIYNDDAAVVVIDQNGQRKIKFVNCSDVHRLSQLNFPDHSLAYTPEFNVASDKLRTVDILKSGFPSLFVIPSSSLFSNSMYYRFTYGSGNYYPAYAAGISLKEKFCTADIDHDGYDDIVTISSPYVTFFKNSSCGIFPVGKMDTEINSECMQVADFNGDTLPDLIVADAFNVGFYVYMNIGNFQFSSPSFYNTSYVPEDIVAADFNNDGFNDILFLKHGSYIQVYLGDGNGGFTGLPEQAISNSSTGLRIGAKDINVGDFNNDNNLDFSMSFEWAGLIMFYGDGAGSFPTEFTPPQSSSAQSTGIVVDLNFDGYADYLTASPFPSSGAVDSHIYDPVSHSYNNKTRSVSASASSISTADFNNDGLMDFVTTSENISFDRDGCVFMQAPNHQPVRVANLPAGEGTTHSALSDLNKDGKKDIVIVSDITNTFSIYYNELPSSPLITIANDSLFATITDSSASYYNYTWFYNDSLISFGSDSWLAGPISNGTYWVMITGDSGYFATSNIQLTNVSLPLEMKNIEVNLYPNPVNDILYIKQKNTNHKLNVSVTDLHGRIIASFIIKNENTYSYNCKDLSNGIYFVKIEDIITKKTEVKKIVKSN